MATTTTSFFLSTFTLKPQPQSLPSSITSFTNLSFPSSARRFQPLLLPSSRIGRNVAVVSSEYEVSDDDGVVQNFSPDLKLFVGNLPFSVESSDLAGLFANAGTVEMVEVIYDKFTGKSRGFGFVTMSSVEEVEAAAQQFDGYEFEGRQLRVNAGPPPPKDSAPRFRRGGSSFENGNRVHVGNLSWNVDDSALRDLFSDSGEILEAKVIYDRDSGRSRGFGFVTYSSAQDVNNAIESLDGADFNGRNIRVSAAEARQRPRF